MALKKRITQYYSLCEPLLLQRIFEKQHLKHAGQNSSHIKKPLDPTDKAVIIVGFSQHNNWQRMLGGKKKVDKGLTS